MEKEREKEIKMSQINNEKCKNVKKLKKNQA